MNRREFLKWTALAAAAAARLGLLFGKDEAVKPNFIIILADDLGYGDVGCYGNKTILTPHLDRMAGRGMKFTDFHSNGAVCSPTRAALLTGRYQQRCGIEGVITAAGHRDKGMPLDEVTFAEVLKAAGYRTAIFGKWHLGYDAKFNPTRQGFDEFRGFVAGNVDYHSHVDQAGHEDWWSGGALGKEEGYTTDLITDHAVRFIRENKDTPFCLYLPHAAPHYPYQGPKDKADRSVSKPQPIGGSRKDKAAAYKEMIEAMDDSVAQVLKTVEELGLEERTLVFFFSDNGPGTIGSAGALRGHKGNLYEGGHRVPAIAYWAGRITPGSVSDAPAMGADLLPTMAALAGAPLPRGRTIDGVDISPVLLECKPLPQRAMFWRFGPQKCVREGPWKLYVTKDGAELYNLADDLGEKNDLAAAHPQRVSQLGKLLSAWEKEVEQSAAPSPNE